MSDSAAMSEDGPERTFHAALEKGEFLIQKCTACARAVFYPRVLCPHCGSNALTWIRPSGAGVVYSTTVARPPGESATPYNIALVDLDEGARMMSRVDGVAPEAVRIGMRVLARVTIGPAGPIVVFRPAASTADA